MALPSYVVRGVPGVYRRARERVAEAPRVRTDVVGFVGIAGANRLDEAVRIDDWRSYEQVYLRDAGGHAVPPPPGSALADAVRAFFANGGARCWIVNVAVRVDTFTDEGLLARMLGIGERAGLELLLLRGEVAIVAMPELDAVVAEAEQVTKPLPPLADQGTFVCCPGLHRLEDPVATERTFGRRIFTNDQVRFAQRYLIERCGRLKWRVFVVLAPPPGLTAKDVVRWRDAITENVADPDCAALYWPWLRVQDKPGEPVRLQSPVGHVVGVFARRDLALGPHVAPANETLRDVVAVEHAIDDAVNEQVYDNAVNVIRGFPGHGIQIWGARTLAWKEPKSDPHDALGWINVRRCLSSIERNVDRIGQVAVFEPNLPMLRLQVAAAVSGHLLEVLASGALQAEEQDEAFFVRCDSAENTPSVVDAGQLICVVGVAIAAPAEFLVFRVGRREGVVELQEVAG